MLAPNCRKKRTEETDFTSGSTPPARKAGMEAMPALAKLTMNYEDGSADLLTEEFWSTIGSARSTCQQFAAIKRNRRPNAILDLNGPHLERAKLASRKPWRAIIAEASCSRTCSDERASFRRADDRAIEKLLRVSGN